MKTRMRLLEVRALFYFLIICISSAWATPNITEARGGTCGPIYLRTAEGDIINPITGINAGEPFSTRKTCGACHDYDTITKGYHFQQGWDRIRDDFDDDKPWILSDGMMGKQ